MRRFGTTDVWVRQVTAAAQTQDVGRTKSRICRRSPKTPEVPLRCGVEKFFLQSGETKLERPIQSNGFQLTLADYERWAAKYAQYPGAGTVHGLIYATVGLAGEVGELANKVKKVIRDADYRLHPAAADSIAAELGDVLWYVSALAKELGVSLDTVGKDNLAKLPLQNPEYGKLFRALAMYRSLSTFESNFLNRRLESNGRLIYTINVAGTNSFRWSTNENPWGRGMNMQNIPDPKEEQDETIELSP